MRRKSSLSHNESQTNDHERYQNQQLVSSQAGEVSLPIVDGDDLLVLLQPPVLSLGGGALSGIGSQVPAAVGAIGRSSRTLLAAGSAGQTLGLIDRCEGSRGTRSSAGIAEGRGTDWTLGHALVREEVQLEHAAWAALDAVPVQVVGVHHALLHAGRALEHGSAVAHHAGVGVASALSAVSVALHAGGSLVEVARGAPVHAVVSEQVGSLGTALHADSV